MNCHTAIRLSFNDVINYLMWYLLWLFTKQFAEEIRLCFFVSLMWSQYILSITKLYNITRTNNSIQENGIPWNLIWLSSYWNTPLHHTLNCSMCPVTEYILSLNVSSLFGDLILTHWSRVTHICVSKITIISSDNGLSPGRCHAII